MGDSDSSGKPSDQKNGGGGAGGKASNAAKGTSSIRDRLLLKEVNELAEDLPSTCDLRYDDPDELHDFYVTIRPDEGFWKNGQFLFHVEVTEEYNMSPPSVKCRTRLWHPNINEEGSICLSLLRKSSIDQMAWSPARRIKDVIWGLHSLFTEDELLNFDDPLNREAADQYRENAEAFKATVKEYIRNFAQAQ